MGEGFELDWVRAGRVVAVVHGDGGGRSIARSRRRRSGVASPSSARAASRSGRLVFDFVRIRRAIRRPLRLSAINSRQTRSRSARTRSSTRPETRELSARLSGRAVGALHCRIAERASRSTRDVVMSGSRRSGTAFGGHEVEVHSAVDRRYVARLPHDPAMPSSRSRSVQPMGAVRERTAVQCERVSERCDEEVLEHVRRPETTLSSGVQTRQMGRYG